MAKKKSKKNYHGAYRAKHNHQSPYDTLKTDILNEMTVPHRDRTSSEYMREVKRIAERNIQETISFINRDKRCKGLVERFKFNGVCQKRRIAAFCEYAPLFAEKFSTKYPNVDIEESIAEICAIPVVSNPDEMDEDYYIVLACAIFILDELRNNHSFDEAVLYIPDEEELISEIDLPDDFTDSCFENDVIRGMMYLIVHRNDSIKNGVNLDTFLNDVTARQTSENISPLPYTKPKLYSEVITDISSYKKQLKAEADNMTYRDRFDKVLSFFRPIVAERAVKRYEEKMWEHLERVLGGIEYFKGRYNKSLEKAIETLEAIEKIRIDYLKDVQELSEIPRNSAKSLASISKLGNLPEITTDNLTSSIPNLSFLSNDADIVKEKIAKYGDRLGELEDEKNLELFHIRTFISYAFCNDFDLKKVKDATEEIKLFCKNQVEGFRVSNPFETCFAYLWLVDRGSNIPWLGGVGSVPIKYACKLLPWDNIMNDALFEEMENFTDEDYEDEPDNEQEEADITEYTSTLLNDCPEDTISLEETFYTPSYTDYYEWAVEGYKRVRKDDLLHINFPQFIFSETRVNIPRSLKEYEEYVEGYKKSGFSVKHIDLLRMYLNLGSEFSLKKGFPKLEYDKAIDEVQEAETSATLKKTIAEKNEEISQLKKQLHKAEKERDNEKDRSDTIKAEYEADRRELIELRELIYKIQNDADEEITEEQEKIEFPYNAKKRLVIFGGHESWLRVIKPMLPNVRFISPYTKPDTNLIRNADIVWMQSNAMPHSFYNKIMEIVRIKDIPVKYFAYASAEKCARQLAEYDMNGQD